MKRAAALLGTLVALAGCGPSYPSPFTADAMAKDGTADALVHYLGQTGATAAVCDRKSEGPRFRRLRPPDFAKLTDGLVDGAVPPELWQRCTLLMLESMPADEAALLLEAVVRGHREVLSRSAVEKEERERAKAEALTRVLMLRPRGTSPREEVVGKDVAALRQALEKRRLGPVASRYGKDILTTIDIERGHFRGAKLSPAALDTLEKEKNETLLRLITMRSPDPSLQEEAKRRIVRLHIAASPVKAVREHADEVEAIVMRTGRNAIDVTKSAPTTAWLDEDRVRVRGVLARQDIAKQTVTLLAHTQQGKAPGSSVLPSVGLRGAFWARVPGYADPVTLCGSPNALDVTPCLLPSDLRPKVPIVYVDADGLLHFVERITSADAVKLVHNTPNLPLPFEVNGQTVLTIEWPIVYERPEPIVFTGSTSGRGPDLRVRIERRYSQRLMFEVSGEGKKRIGVVEQADLPSFTIATRGGAGTSGSTGASGANGASGSAGMPGSCPFSPGGTGGTGSPGGNGSPGGPGGPGGAGGDIVASVACVTGDCAMVAAAVQRFVRSEGGAGGAGGMGGRGGTGGAGGSGGSGASCSDGKGHYTSVPSGSPGMKGSDGSPGARGADGPAGAPGKVDIRVTPDG